MIALCVVQVSRAQIKVTSNGDVGIGTSTPSEDVELQGNKIMFSFPSTSNHIDIFPYYGATPCIDPSSNGNGTIGYNYYWGNIRTYTITRTTEANLSDQKLKKNIQPIENPLGIIKQLNPVTYDLIPELYESVQNKKQKEQLIQMGMNNFGLIAQETEKILPSIVYYDSVFEAKTISYSQLIPILIKALQEQQGIIEEQDARLEKLESAKPKEKSVSLDNNLPAVLKQNIPNPFINNTRIDIFLPETVKNANLYVYNMQGVQIKSFSINDRGNTAVTIEGFSLQAGMLCHYLKFCNDGLSQMA